MTTKKDVALMILVMLSILLSFVLFAMRDAGIFQTDRVVYIAIGIVIFSFTLFAYTYMPDQLHQNERILKKTRKYQKLREKKKSLEFIKRYLDRVNEMYARKQRTKMK